MLTCVVDNHKNVHPDAYDVGHRLDEHKVGDGEVDNALVDDYDDS